MVEHIPHKWAIVRRISRDGNNDGSLAYIHVNDVVYFEDWELHNTHGELIKCGKVVLVGGHVLYTEEDFAELADSLLNVEVCFDDGGIVAKGGLS